MKIASVRILVMLEKLIGKLNFNKIYYLYDVLDILRERYNIIVIVYQSNQPDEQPIWEWGYNITKVNQPTVTLYTQQYFSTYNEALRHGIEKALEHILYKKDDQACSL